MGELLQHPGPSVGNPDLRSRTLLLSLALACLACAPGKAPGLSQGDSSSDAGSSSGGSSSGGSSDTSDSSDTSAGESDTGDVEEDVCPADPELEIYVSKLDGEEEAIFFRGRDGLLTWTHACEVVAHTGELASGEIIELQCLDADQLPVTHEIEVQTTVAGAPTAVPVSVGQSVTLQVWVRVWHGGTMAWTLRDEQQTPLLIHYDGPFLPNNPTRVEEEFAAPPEIIAPLLVEQNLDVCPLVCGGALFIPDDCCVKETALRFDLGAGPVEVLDESAAAIPGGGFAVVGRATYFDDSSPDCIVADISTELYRFTVIGSG